MLRGQAVNRGGSPYHPWRDVIAALILRTDPGDVDASVLATIVPNTAALLGRPIEPMAAIGVEADQTRLLLAVEQLFRMQARPVAVLLEDMHWAGSESLRLLAWLVQTAQQRPLLFVASYRDDESPSLPEAVPDTRLIKVPRLERSQIAALGAAMVGAPAERVELLDLLERETEGIPFFVVEVVRTLAETSGALDRIGNSRLPERVISGACSGSSAGASVRSRPRQSRPYAAPRSLDAKSTRRSFTRFTQASTSTTGPRSARVLPCSRSRYPALGILP